MRSRGNDLEGVAVVSLRLLFCEIHHITHSPQIRELHEVLATATRRVANLLNEGTLTHRLPPELLTRLFDLVLDHGSEEHPKQIIPLTHVCRYWRTVILSHPRMWSTISLKPGDPSFTSEWLVRSHNVPLTIIAEFADAYEHPPCRYQDSPTATLADTNHLEVCLRHQAILSLDQLLPHRSRIHNLNCVLRFSDPNWEEDDLDHEPTLLSHHFFEKSLPNLQSLDFRAIHIEQSRYTVPIPDLLFGGNPPRLKELKYLGVTGGLIWTVKNLISCEMGWWSESAGPTIIGTGELEVFLNNNKTLESLAIDDFEPSRHGPWEPVATLMPNLKFFKIECSMDMHLEKLLRAIRIPQLKDLDTIHVSLRSSRIEAVATDSSGHTFEFWRFIHESLNFHPLRHFGADIITLRLDPGITLEGLKEGPGLCEFFVSLGAVQVLEFDGMNVDCVREILFLSGVFPNLKVIWVTVSRDDCERTLQVLASVSKLRMGAGNPLTTIRLLVAEGGDGLNQELCAEWEKCYDAEGIQNFLSK